MNYQKILKSDVANSVSGFTVTLFVSGCDRHCKGCFNPESWDCCSGKKFTEKEMDYILHELEQPWYRGFSLLGGDPLSRLSDNRKTCIEICRKVKEKFPEKVVYLWSGYTKQEIESDDEMKDILKYVDVLVDGPFMEELKKDNLVLRGSSNQNVIGVSILGRSIAERLEYPQVNS